FSDRIIGLRDGRIVFQGVSSDVTETVLTQIYGEEDWSTTIRKTDEAGENSEPETPQKKNNGLLREGATG
ncbi:MAG: hypothetical protein PVI60_07590, partial [Desulfobacteraceae bacterium]